MLAAYEQAGRPDRRSAQVGELVMRRACTLLLSVVLGTTMAACADAPGTDVRDVTIRPRVVVDGTLELADRTGGRIVLEGIVAHADEARVVAANDTLTVDDRIPLFFSFAPDGVSDQLAAERTWSVPVDGGTITMGFGPAADDVDSASVSAGLGGHTALIHGTIAVSPDGFSAFGDTGEIDPDGSPAIPDAPPDGEVDPDGTPARPIKGEVDPDGTPARPIKGGEVDPDGSPARNAIVDSIKQHQKMSGASARGQVIVPFTLVVDGAFEHHTTLTATEIATVGADEVLPLDLRIKATDIFTVERLASLEALAQQAIAAGRQAQGLAVAVSATTTSRALDVTVHAPVAARDVALEGAPQINHRMVVGAVR